MKENQKKKIKTKNKSYPIHKSPLYRITYLKRLYKILVINPEQPIILSNANYNVFSQGKKKRIIEQPLSPLYEIHNKLASFLCRLKVPDYLYSGIKGRSYIDNAKVHCNENEVFTIDIKSFFPATSKEQVFKLFRNTFECSHQIANELASICTFEDHIPTGSQISMPLAYWANSKMFDELHAFAQQFQLKMTIYVDDITFSGKKIPPYFRKKLNEIVERHGHQLNQSKTKFYPKHYAKEITVLIIKNNKITTPSRKKQDLHLLLEEWDRERILPRNRYKLEKLYAKLNGSLNNIANFSNGYKNVTERITQEYHKYLNNPQNFQPAES